MPMLYCLHVPLYHKSHGISIVKCHWVVCDSRIGPLFRMSPKSIGKVGMVYRG